MSNELVAFDEEKIGIIKEMFCKNATKAEFELFIHMAQRLQLDPICKQIYFIKFGTQMSIVVGIDGYRSIAERSGTYMPGREPTFHYDEKGGLLSCTAYAKKWSDMDKQWHEIAATAFLSEYDTGKNQWAKGKHFMLAKTTEALVLRKGWPNQLAGTNTDDEMEKVILDVESKKSEPKHVQIEQKGPCISIADAIKVNQIIGDDSDYRNRILSHYKAQDFIDIEQKHLDLIISKAKEHSAERAKKEMEMV